MTEQTKSDEIRKEDQPEKVDSMATVVTDLIKTKDILIEKQDSDIESLNKKIAELEKTANQNPVDSGSEQKQSVKVTDADDVGTKADAKNDVAPKPSEAQASIIPPAVKEPGTDSAGLSMENKADEESDKKPEEKKAEEVKKEDEKKDAPKAEEKKEEKKEYMDKSNDVYKVVETVRPIMKTREHIGEKPTAYQMLKALENGFGETKNANQALVLMHQKMQSGEFGDGLPAHGGAY